MNSIKKVINWTYITLEGQNINSYLWMLFASQHEKSRFSPVKIMLFTSSQILVIHINKKWRNMHLSAHKLIDFYLSQLNACQFSEIFIKILMNECIGVQEMITPLLQIMNMLILLNGLRGLIYSDLWSYLGSPKIFNAQYLNQKQNNWIYKHWKVIDRNATSCLSKN